MADEHVIAKAVDLLLRAAPAGSKVILFGSHARGEARPDSDLDFVVVEPRVRDRLAEMVRLREALRPLHVAADVLVVSAKTYEEWRDTPNTVVYGAAQEGKVYEQSHRPCPMNWPEHVLEECRNRVKGYYNRILENDEPQSDDEKVARGIALTALDFGLNELLAVGQELSSGRAVQAAILCRPLFELAACVCWASGEDGGYGALDRGSVKAETEWLRSVAKVEPWKSSCGNQLSESEAECVRLASKKHVPGMKGLLKAIIEHDGPDAAEAKGREEFYYSIYKEFSLFAHAKVRAIWPATQQSAVAQNAVLLCVFSTHLLLASAAGFVAASGDDRTAILDKESKKTQRLIHQCAKDKFSFPARTQG